MEFDKTKWSCPWNSNQNYTQNSARGRWDRGMVGVIFSIMRICVFHITLSPDDVIIVYQMEWWWGGGTEGGVYSGVVRVQRVGV